MRLARAIAFGVPLALFVISAAPSAYWLDSGEFVAAAMGIAVAHPPGHPLYVLTTKLWTLLPLGPIAFRVSLASGLAAAVCALALFATARQIARRAGATEAASTALAFAAAVAVTTSRSLGLQAVRGEVYALEALLTIGAMSLAAHAATGADRRHLVAAGLLAGLSLSNHHFLGLLAFPSLAAALALCLLGPRAVTPTPGDAPAPAPAPPPRAPGLLRATLAAGALGLVPYAMLPLRASAPESVAAPADLVDFFWVVSAKVYQKSTGLVAESALQRIADVILLIGEDLAGLGLVAAMGGLYVLVRVPALRRHAAVWIPAALLYPLARAWLGFIRDNPDAAGYVVPGLAALALAAVAFAGAALAALPAGRPEIGRIALLVAVAMSIVIGPGRYDRYSLARFWAAEDLVGSVFEDLGPRGVVVATHFETVFVAAGMRATRAERPDVTVLGLPFLGYPGYAGSAARRDRGVADLVRATLLEGNLAETELAALAAVRPTVVEPDAIIPPDVRPYLQPRGLCAVAFGEPVSLADLVASGDEHRAKWASLAERLRPWSRDDRETRNVLLWHRYLEALLYASRGARDLAYESAEAGEAAMPGATELLELRLALRKGRGPLDVTPFLPRTELGRE